jgi:hypothetical protein
MLTFIVLRTAAYKGVDRHVRVGLTAVAVVAVLGASVGRDDFSVGYWAIGFVFGVILHDSLPRQGDRSA